MENLFVYLMATAIFGLLFFLFRFAIKQRQEMLINFQNLGQKYNLRSTEIQGGVINFFISRYPVLEGNLSEGIQIRIYAEVRGSGKHKQQYICFDMNSRNGRSFEMSIMNEGWYRKLGKLLHLQKDIQLGVEEFDAHFILKGSDESFVKNVLSDLRIRDLILNQKDLFPYTSFHYKGGRVSCEMLGSYTGKTKEKFDRCIELYQVLILHIEQQRIY